MNKALFLTPLLGKEREMRSRGREKKKWRTVWLLLKWGEPYISHMADRFLGAPSLGG